MPLKSFKLTFLCVSKTYISLLPCVLKGHTKAVSLKGSSHDMTSSAFDCVEISTCVCSPPYVTPPYSDLLNMIHICTSTASCAHTDFFRLWAQNFHFNFHHMIAVAYVLPNRPYISHHANEMEYHSSAADGQG